MSTVDAGEVLISAVGVVKALGGRTILADAGLEVHRAEVVTLIGPNGAGKSTLIRVLLGLLRPDAGSVERKPGLTVGYLPQRMQLDPALPLTVSRFLALAGAGAERVAEALAETGVADSADKQVNALSGGEFQRVLLARAIVRAPDLLVLDEPLQGVDVAGQAELYRLIGRLRRDLGVAVLMVSHDLHLVMAETDQVVCLNRHVCCAGRPEMVSRHPAFLELFGPALAIYTHDHDHDHDGAGAPLAPGGGAGADHG